MHFSAIVNLLNLAEMGFGAAIVYTLYEPISKNDKQETKILQHTNQYTDILVLLFYLLVFLYFRLFTYL